MRRAKAMRKAALILAIGIASVAAAQAVNAQSIRIGPGGVSLDFAPPPPPPEPAPVIEEPPAAQLINRREAREIALGQGMIEIVALDRDDTQYVVRGLDDTGSRMRITIDGLDGRVLEVVRRQAELAPPPDVEVVEEEGEPLQRAAPPRGQQARQPSVQRNESRPQNVRRDSGVPGQR
jgi:hypothetical protein